MDKLREVKQEDGLHLILADGRRLGVGGHAGEEEQPERKREQYEAEAQRPYGRRRHRQLSEGCCVFR